MLESSNETSLLIILKYSKWIWFNNSLHAGQKKLRSAKIPTQYTLPKQLSNVSVQPFLFCHSLRIHRWSVLRFWWRNSIHFGPFFFVSGGEKNTQNKSRKHVSLRTKCEWDYGLREGVKKRTMHNIREQF